MRNLLAIALLISQCLFAGSSHAEVRFPHTDLTIGMYRVDAEVAADQIAREQGLMFRREMASNAGMVFVFDTAQEYCMWMKNTLIPLSVAFMDDTGKIINIEDMKPQTEDSHCAKAPAKFALEMNLGWFKAKGFAAGTKIRGLEKFGAKP